MSALYVYREVRRNIREVLGPTNDFYDRFFREAKASNEPTLQGSLLVTALLSRIISAPVVYGLGIPYGVSLGLVRSIKN